MILVLSLISAEFLLPVVNFFTSVPVAECSMFVFSLACVGFSFSIIFSKDFSFFHFTSLFKGF